MSYSIKVQINSILRDNSRTWGKILAQNDKSGAERNFHYFGYCGGLRNVINPVWFKTEEYVTLPVSRTIVENNNNDSIKRACK